MTMIREIGYVLAALALGAVALWQWSAYLERAEAERHARAGTLCASLTGALVSRKLDAVETGLLRDCIWSGYVTSDSIRAAKRSQTP